MGFDFLAPIYDSFARLIFGKSITASQTLFLDQVPPNSTVLILGGGTGWLLEELIRQNPSCTVWYIEASSKMIERTRHRKLNNRVHLIQGTEADIPTNAKIDVVITNFYLDLFSENKLKNVIQHITDQSAPSARWLVTDFVNKGMWWHKWMLKIMYIFFRIVCNIEASHLPIWAKQLNDRKWGEMNSKHWYGAFIKSTVWHRT